MRLHLRFFNSQNSGIGRDKVREWECCPPGARAKFSLSLKLSPVPPKKSNIIIIKFDFMLELFDFLTIRAADRRKARRRSDRRRSPQGRAFIDNTPSAWAVFSKKSNRFCKSVTFYTKTAKVYKKRYKYIYYRHYHRIGGKAGDTAFAEPLRAGHAAQNIPP